jgi:MFS family permease
MADQGKGKIKLAIFSFSILMMGVIAIAGGLGEIGAHFGSMSIAMQLVALPSIPIIIVTLLVGKITEYISMKKLVIFGILCYLVGGVAPGFMESVPAILVMRCVFGVGVGIVQALSSALVGANFDGDERGKVMGQQLSAQMIGAAVCMFVGGILARIGWNITFFVHFIAVISFICVAAFLPDTPPQRKTASSPEQKASLTKGAIGWAFALLAFFLPGMILAQYMAGFLIEQNLGGPVESGTATMIFAIGGFVMGLVYGKLAQGAKNFTFAVGFLVSAISYLLVAFAPNLPMAFVGALGYGFGVTIVVATAMGGTASSVMPWSIPLAISITTCGQNIGSYFCPMVTSAVAGLMGDDVSKNAFLFGAIMFAVMTVIALIWGASKKAKPAGA